MSTDLQSAAGQDLVAHPLPHICSVHIPLHGLQALHHPNQTLPATRSYGKLLPAFKTNQIE